MRSQPGNSAGGPTRRDFIKTAAQTAAVAAGVDLLPATLYARGRIGKVAVVSDPKDSLAGEQPVRWAVEQLQNRLKDLNEHGNHLKAISYQENVSFQVQIL